MHNQNRMFGRGTDVIEIINKDCTGRKIEKYRANSADEEEIAKIFQAHIDKYNLNLKIIKAQNTGKFDWLKADEEFKW